MRLLILYMLLLCVLWPFQGASGSFAGSITDVQDAKQDTLLVKAYSDLCWEYRFKSADSSLMFGNRALDLAKKLNYRQGIAQAYNDMAIIFIDKGNYHRATNYLDEAMRIRSVMNDQSGIASVHNKLGIIDQKQGRLKEALEHQLAALQIYEQQRSDRWIGYTYNNIAIIHQNLENVDKALEFHKKALEFRLKLNDRLGEATSYSNMANLYARKHDTIRAVSYYEKALDLARTLNNEELISGNLSNISNIYLARKEYPKALKYFEESLKIREKLGDSKGISSTLSRIGTLFSETGRYREALETLTRSLRMAREISVVEEEMSALLALAKLKALTNELSASFVLMNSYIRKKDSLYNARIKQQILDVQTQYETEQLEQDLELVRKEKENAEIKLQQRKTVLLMILFIVISIAGAAIFLFYRHLQRQKAAAAAEKIRENEARLNAVLEGQEEERRRIARELHDGLGQTLTAIKLNYQALAGKVNSEEQVQEFLKLESMLDSANAEVRSISHQMMPRELEQFGLIAAVEGSLKLVFDKTSVKYNFEHSGFNERIGSHSELVLFRVLQELLNNVIKHSGANMLNVQLLKLSSHVVLNVSDNGIGFDVDKHEKKGIGLLNIAGRIDGIKGHLHYESAPGKGTTVTIRIPAI